MTPPTTISVRIGQRTETFLLFQTNAPRVYDHASAIQLYDGTHNGKVERYVLVPEDLVEWQRLRNGSGLHSFVTDDVVLDASDLERYLWTRLFEPQA
jgi:hypothetical protein